MLKIQPYTKVFADIKLIYRRSTGERGVYPLHGSVMHLHKALAQAHSCRPSGCYPEPSELLRSSGKRWDVTLAMVQSQHPSEGGARAGQEGSPTATRGFYSLPVSKKYAWISPWQDLTFSNLPSCETRQLLSLIIKEHTMSSWQLEHS